MSNLIRFSTTLIRRTRIYQSSRLLSQDKAKLSHTATTKHVEKDEALEDAPIKYTASPAYKWQAKDSRTGNAVPRLWYEPYVILVSLVVFMTYFFILREENQVDKDLERTLYSRISGLEEYQLKASLDHNRAHGLSTKEIEERLAELARS